QFYNAVSLNSAYVYLTTSDYEADEGSYVAEVGQLSGNLTSALDYRILKASESGVTTVGVDQLRRGFHFENGLLFSWNHNEFTINDFGGSLPLNEVVDSAVARVEEKYTGNTQLVFQIGANEGHNMIAGIDDMSAGALGITSVSLDVTTQDKAERTIMVIDAAIHKVSTARASLGAIQNRLEHTIANLGVAAENLTAAESRIRDADMAKEMMTFVKQQILLQSANAMLAQANALPQNVLQLLR
ncbi:MAG: flagellin, partial [Thermotogae bacterium]|nr:flagellin [Thermotogota bacterium]